MKIAKNKVERIQKERDRWNATQDVWPVHEITINEQNYDKKEELNATPRA